MTSSATRSLDQTVLDVHRHLAERSVPSPRALFLMATGASLFAEHLGDVREVELGEIEGCPEPWRSEVLFAGTLGELPSWCLNDVSGEPRPGVAFPWERGFPVWLAASAGASVCVHTSAGSALDEGDEGPRAPVGGFALVRDHLNLSGETPLRGLGESALGPLFPDTTHLHHLGLRRAALGRAEALGLKAAEAVAACAPGPALETAAERRMFARAGADVTVQSLSVPLLAAAHAGLAVLAVVAVTDAGEATDVARLVERAAEAEPALDALLVALAEDLGRAARVLSEEAPR